MTDEDVNKLRTVVKEEIGTALKPINNRLGTVENKLGNVEHKLDVLWDQTGRLTGDMEGVKETLDSHTEILKRIEDKVDTNSDDMLKVNTRLTKVEGHLGIVPPPELTIAG